jgi:hypothetical protein
LVQQGRLTSKGDNFVAGLVEQVDRLAELQHIALGSFKRQFPLFQLTERGLQWNMVNGASNPYLVVLELLQAGIAGIEQGKKLANLQTKEFNPQV